MNKESFLMWLKQEIEGCGPDVSILATSGVHTTDADDQLTNALLNLPEARALRRGDSNEFGLQSLRAAIRRAYGVPEGHEIVLTKGATGGLSLIIRALFPHGASAGEEIILESPIYEPILLLAQSSGAVIRRFSRAVGTDVVDGIEEQLSHATRAVFLTNLHNPTGDHIPPESLAALCELASRVAHDCLIVVDETFTDLGPNPGITSARFGDRLVVVSSLAKAYGLGEAKCGWVSASRTAFPELRARWASFEGGGSKILEVLGLELFVDLERLRAASHSHLAKNRTVVRAWIESMNKDGLLQGDMPTYGCLAFLRAPGFTEMPVKELRDRFGVLVSPGSYFSRECSDHMRIGFGGSTVQLIQGLERIRYGLESLHGTSL